MFNEGHHFASLVDNLSERCIEGQSVCSLQLITNDASLESADRHSSISFHSKKMSRLKFDCVTFCLFVIVSLSDGASLPEKCGQQKVTNGLIYGGSELSNAGQFPWAGVLLRKDTIKPFCGCSLISNEFAVTAAHCFHQKNAETTTSMSSVVVQFGRYDLSDDDEEDSVTRSINDLIMHNDWNPRADRYDADIAVIRFNEIVNFSNRIQPICLPKTGESIRESGFVVSICTRCFHDFTATCCRLAGESLMRLENLQKGNCLLNLMLSTMKFAMKCILIALRTFSRRELTAVASRTRLTESILVVAIAASKLMIFDIAQLIHSPQQVVDSSSRM